MVDEFNCDLISLILIVLKTILIILSFFVLTYILVYF